MLSDQKVSRFDWADCWRLILSRWALVLLITSIVLAIGSALLWTTPRLYQAHAIIGLNEHEATKTSARRQTEVQSKAANFLKREIAELHSTSVLLGVVDACTLSERWGVSRDAALSKLRQQTSVVRSEDRISLELHVKGTTRDEAAEIANAWAKRYTDLDAERHRQRQEQEELKLKEEIASTQERIARVEQALATASDSGSSSQLEEADKRRQLVDAKSYLTSLDAKLQSVISRPASTSGLALELSVEARPEDARIIGSFWVSFSILAGLGFFLGSLLAILPTSMGQDRWTLAEKLASRLQVTIVGDAPFSLTSLARHTGEVRALTEPYRDLRVQMGRLPTDESTLVSLIPVERTKAFSETAVNLACVFADSGKTTLLIDANTRHPSLHAYFEHDPAPGLGDYLKGETGDTHPVKKTGRKNLWLITAGTALADPSALIGNKRMSDLIWNMRLRFDYIFLLAPSVLDYAEAGILVGAADHTLVVTPTRRTDVRQLQRIKKAVDVARGNLSVVLLSYHIKTDDAGAIPVNLTATEHHAPSSPVSSPPATSRLSTVKLEKKPPAPPSTAPPPATEKAPSSPAPTSSGGHVPVPSASLLPTAVEVEASPPNTETNHPTPHSMATHTSSTPITNQTQPVPPTRTSPPPLPPEATLSPLPATAVSENRPLNSAVKVSTVSLARKSIHGAIKQARPAVGPPPLPTEFPSHSTGSSEPRETQETKVFVKNLSDYPRIRRNQSKDHT